MTDPRVTSAQRAFKGTPLCVRMAWIAGSLSTEKCLRCYGWTPCRSAIWKGTLCITTSCSLEKSQICVNEEVFEDLEAVGIDAIGVQSEDTNTSGRLQ